MHSRLDSIESGNFFFQPAQLHLKPADLLVQFRHQGVLVLDLSAAIVRKHFRRPFHQPLLPLPDLRRMHAEGRHQLTRGAVAPHCRQGNLRFHARFDPSSLRYHTFLPKLDLSYHGYDLKSWSSFARPVYHSDVYFPTYSNGLKDIGKYLGFSWTDANASGLQSLAWRRRWDMTGGDDFKQKLIVYNSEDCRALKRVTETLEAIGQKQQGVEGSTVAWEEVESEPTGRDWNKIGFVLPDFDHINKCAYFDYQRDKLSVRNGSTGGRKRSARAKTAKATLDSPECTDGN